MFSFLFDFLEKKRITCFAPIGLSHCRVVRPYLLERVGITEGTAVMLAVPYFTKACLSPDRNLSSYAVSRDYHAFFSALFDELLPLLRERCPHERFAGFADHSPIAETEAAAMAGLGVIGDNHMLITKDYSSYVFLGEILTSVPTDARPSPISSCEQCGKCKEFCPMNHGESLCRSALTQQKGALSEEERQILLRHPTVWGCDICQEVCPHTIAAIRRGSIFSPIPFFSEDAIPHLTREILDNMDEETFLRRAYAWRGRQTIARNLDLNHS